MFLQFESTDELDSFLNWAKRLAAPVNAVIGADLCALDLAPIARAEPEPEFAAPTPPTSEQFNGAAVQVEEPTKRKRRTKAEIQADKERETGLQQPGTLPEGQGTEPGSSTPEATGNAAVQAALAGDTTGAAAALANVPVNDNPFAGMQSGVEADEPKAEQQKPTGATVPPAVKPTTPEEIRYWINATAIGKFNAITPVDHLNVAKAFIGSKGNAVYGESFALVGLPNNIMAYTQEQRALHAAALDFLDWA
jgi:hypothetical protein